MAAGQTNGQRNGRSRFLACWVATFSLPAVVQITLSVWFSSAVKLDAPHALFWIVVIAGSSCMVTSSSLIVRSFRTDEADLAAVGIFFYAVSVLPLVHGLTTPGVLFGPNTSTSSSVLWAIPLGLIAAAPFALPRPYRPEVFHRRWKLWTAASVVAINAVGLALLINVNLLPAPTPRGALSIGVAVASLCGCIILSYRHLRLARIAQRGGPLVVSLGYGFVGASALVWLGAEPFSGGFWAAHALDIVGVFSATIGGLVVYRTSAASHEVFASVTAVEPLAALEVGLDPVVHRFVADLDIKDRITRDHVVRTAELAVRVAEELRLKPDAVRRVGLAAILHDVGKLDIPDDVLKKPARLTDAEFQIIRTHAVLGEQLVRSSLVLDDIAPAVRGHHERMDGGGYPDGLAGLEIPHDARIVAVCDAYDAMANTRQYREGMGQDKAIAILREHAGSQWDAVVVEALVDVVLRDPPARQPTSALDATGRNVDADGLVGYDRVGCDCLPESLLVVAGDGTG